MKGKWGETLKRSTQRDQGKRNKVRGLCKVRSIWEPIHNQVSHLRDQGQDCAYLVAMALRLICCAAWNYCILKRGQANCPFLFWFFNSPQGREARTWCVAGTSKARTMSTPSLGSWVLTFCPSLHSATVYLPGVLPA